MSRNLLADAASPYLLQHKDNPVHWRQWGPDTLAEAAATARPILLSVGYAACHWCHVMAHESFEDPVTADLMNRLFVNIKVDREERPDIDQIYMSALHALGETGGWPLTMFLTPAGEPIWGGTYFPPTPRYGRPSFRAVLTEVSRIFREEPGKVEQNRTAILARLREQEAGSDRDPDVGLLDAAADMLLAGMDPAAGGLRGAPKFPQASILEALWRAGRRSGRAEFRNAVLRTLTGLSQGGIYDHLGGGLSRYSVDERWLVPHFEKMLYDNAQFVERLAYAFVATGNPLFRLRIEETVAWLERELSLGEAFAASLDADSDGEEGRFYLWDAEEIDAVLGTDGPAFRAAYDVTPGGNFEGRSILNRLASSGLLDADTEAFLARCRQQLLEVRDRRPRPALDDKVLADWNGLAIAALALAGNLLGRADWVARAEAAYAFIRKTMVIAGGRVGHAWRNGRRVAPGFSSDAAGMIKAALALHDATGAPEFLAEAQEMAAALHAHHWDEAAGAFNFTADDAEALLVRTRSLVDEATPNPNGLMAENLVRLWRRTGDDHYRVDADRIFAAAASAIADNPFAHAALLNALDQRLSALEVVIVARAGEGDALRAAARLGAAEAVRFSVHAHTTNLPPTHPAAGKTQRSGLPTAYVCGPETCSAPIIDPADLTAAVQRSSGAAPIQASS